MTAPINYPTSPKTLWNRFYEITQVPRPSKKEEKFRNYLVNIAISNNLDYKVDQALNVVIYLPATPGYEDHPAVILQSHMDMVCDKLPEIEFDFENDPISLKVVDGWIQADGTTLGADNGYGCACALALIDEKEVSHPLLELLFTVDEETGLNGALNLDKRMLEGRKMINLDSEDFGVIYIGCAGGVEYDLKADLELVDDSSNYKTISLSISGLKGGHSGIDIHKGRANAIKLLGQMLFDLLEVDYKLYRFDGGTAHNIIPRDASCIIKIAPENVDKAYTICKSVLDGFNKYCLAQDEDFSFDFSSTTEELRVLSKKDRDRVVNLINLFPHGAYGFKWDAADPIVNYSSNFAICNISDSVYIQTSLRYLDESEIYSLEQTIKGLGLNFALKVKRGEGYPSWKPVFEDELLTLVKEEYWQNYNIEAKIKVIHAGLECGIIKEKLGDMQIVSLGPNINSVHSPTERIEIESSSKLYELLLKILAKL